MGVDFYLTADSDKHEDAAGFCSRELADELGLLSDLGKGTILDFVSDMDEEEFHDPKVLLASLKKTIAQVKKRDAKEFEGDRDMVIEDLEQAAGQLQNAVDLEINVSVTIG